MAQTILEEKKKSRLMTEGSIWKSILLFSVPLILGNMLQQLYNTADSIIVGNFVGSNALAAVGSSGSPIFLLIGFSQGIAVGAGVVVSQFLGAKDREGAHIAVHTSLALSAILGAILTACGIAVSRALLTAMNTPAEVLEDAVLYMRLYFGGVLFSVVYNMAAGILNAAGNSKRSLLYLGVASITNIVLDLVLIAGCKMGVAGAAIATDISQLVSCVLSLRFLMRVEDDYRVTAKEVRVHKKMAVRIIKVGLPTGIQNMVISLSNVLVQVSVNGYGAAAMAGFAAYMKVDGFNILPVLSFSMAATTFVGQNFGAGKIDRVKKGTFVTLGMCIVYTILTGILLLAFQDPIMHLFTGDETVIAYGKICMLYFCPFYWMLGSILAGHKPTYVHSLMVAELTRALLQRQIETRPETLVGLLGCRSTAEVQARREELCQTAYECGLYHDLGKCAVLMYIDNNARRLLDEEFFCIQSHPRTGADILNRMGCGRTLALAALYHHCYYNGKGGYPNDVPSCPPEIKGIVDALSVADSLDAATDNIGRCYNLAKPFRTLLEELRAQSGTRYAPNVVALFEDERFCQQLAENTDAERKRVYLQVYHAGRKEK